MSARNAPLLIFAVAVAIAVWLRLGSVFGDFPSGDGGLFWVMANDLRANGFVPPDVTTYNTGDIPWVYPPLGLYLVAALGGGLEWFRILPAIFAIATLPAVWLLARSLISERGALVTVVAYGLASPAYLGLIAGGGVTRAPGLLLAVLTLWAVARRYPLAAGVLAGLTLLTHPIAAVYVVFGSAALWTTRGTDRRMLWSPLIALAIGAVWFLPMILRHGLDPLLAGLGSRDIDIIDNAVLLLAETINPPNFAFVLGFVGAAVAVQRRRGDLLAWLVVSAFGAAVVDRWVAIPLAVLAGLAVDSVLTEPARLRSAATVAVAAITAVTGVALSEGPETVTAEQREVMEWAATETPEEATFAVIGYPTDRGTVEWFPALAQRENITTWQGSEWVPGGRDRRRIASEAAGCKIASCLPAVDYYPLRPDCCAQLRMELQLVRSNVYARGTTAQRRLSACSPTDRC